MGSFPSEAGEDAMSDQVGETQHLTGGKISPDEKQDDLFPVSGTESEPTIEVPTAAIIQSNGSTQQESKLTDESIEDDPRPVKRQKQDDSQKDKSPAAPTSSIICSAVSAPQDPTASAISTPDPDDCNVDYSSIIHQSIAEIINLEFIPEVEPLECLSFRDIAGKTKSFLVQVNPPCLSNLNCQ
jgi:hypothetical protein